MHCDAFSAGSSFGDCVSVSVHILANKAHHASAHGGLSPNVLSDICLRFF